MSGFLAVDIGRGSARLRPAGLADTIRRVESPVPSLHPAALRSTPVCPPEISCMRGARDEGAGVRRRVVANASQNDNAAASAASKAEIISSVWPAVKLIRKQASPSGTVGGRMAGTNKPTSRNLADNCTARSASPTHQRNDLTRRGADVPTLADQLAAQFFAPEPTTAAAVVALGAPFRSPPVPRRQRRPGRPWKKHTAGHASTSHSISERLPATNPPTQPSALLSVPMRTWTRSSTPKCSAHAAAVPAEDARGVGLIDQEHRFVPLGQFGQFGQGGQVAVHAEEPVGDDQPPSIPARFGQQAMPGVRNRRADRGGRRPARAGNRPAGWRGSCDRNRPRRRGRPGRQSCRRWRRSRKRTAAPLRSLRTRPGVGPSDGGRSPDRSPADWPRFPSLPAGRPRPRRGPGGDRRPDRGNRWTRS